MYGLVNEGYVGIVLSLFFYKIYRVNYYTIHWVHHQHGGLYLKQVSNIKIITLDIFAQKNSCDFSRNLSTIFWHCGNPTKHFEIVQLKLSRMDFVAVFLLLAFIRSQNTLGIYKDASHFWLIGGILKSLCNHELSVIAVVIVVCDRFSNIHTVFPAETRLIHSDDDDTYKIPGFEVSYRNDQLWNQTTRPPHELISYVRDTFQMLGHETQTSQNYESIFYV